MNCLELQSTEVPAGADWRLCTLGFCFLVIGQGQADLKTLQFWRRLSVGDAVALNKGSEANFRAMAPKGFKASYFQFYPQNLYGFMTLGEMQTLEASNLLGKDNVAYYPATHPFAQSLAKLAEEHSLPGTLDHTCQLLQLIATFLNGNKNAVIDAPCDGDELTDRIVGIIKQLHVSELEEISVEDLARKCGCSRRHLGRVFREHFGNSITAHKMGLRLEKASRLLLSTHSRIIDVAAECGFVHIGQFSAKFKEKYGATPSKWRQITSAKDLLRPKDEGNRHNLGLIAL